MLEIKRRHIDEHHFKISDKAIKPFQTLQSDCNLITYVSLRCDKK